MSQRDSRPIDHSQRATLWPYRTATALLTSFLLLVFLLLILVGLREADALSGDRISAWLLLGAVVLSLVPVFLIVLDRVAASAGSVEAPGGVKISFARVEMSARVDVARATISANLGGTPGVAVADTAGATILQTLKPVLGGEVAVVDLAEGQEWWQTRLLLLAAGATRLGQPRALVFTATVSGKSGRYVAWGMPHDILRMHLQNGDARLKLAYRRAQALAAQWELGEPTAANSSVVTLPWPGIGTGSAAQLYLPGNPPSQLVPEQFLLTELAHAEPPSPHPMPDLAVTVQVLHSLFDPVLRQDSVERGDDDTRWRDAVLDGTDEYLAVTERGAYVTLVSRPAAVNAVVRSLVPADSSLTSGSDALGR